ncbi:MAG: DUF6273 domain-containing protein [Pirellulales bacterium]
MSVQNARPGDIVTFGKYPQSASGADRTPIEWLALERSDDVLPALSRHIFDCKRYHGEFVETTWRDCDLRQWLNGEFFRSAFIGTHKHSTLRPRRSRRRRRAIGDQA